MLPRRGFLLLPASLAVEGCAQPSPPPAYLAELEAGAEAQRPRRPLRLDVARIDIVPLPAGPAVYVIPPAPIVPVEAMIAMARSQLEAVGTAHTGRFLVLTARLDRHPSDPGGLFTGRMEMLRCTMRCGLEILAPDGALLDTTRASAQLAATVPASTQTEQIESATRFMRIAIARLETAFEESIRRDLGPFLAPGLTAGWTG